MLENHSSTFLLTREPNALARAKIKDETQRRAGFTLVELLVSMALTLFIMVILSEVFSTGLMAFRQLKAIGDMQEKLRTAATVIRADLKSCNFDPAGGGPPVTLSALDLTDPAYVPPLFGFFRLWQQQSSPIASTSNFCYFTEGTDGDNIPSFRMNQPTDTILHFSIRLTGDRAENFFSVPATAGAPSPSTVGPVDLQTGNTFNSQIAEVAYFLGPDPIGSTGTTRSGGGATLPLFTLFRRQLIVPNSSADATTLNPTPLQAPPTGLSTNYPPQDKTFFELSARAASSADQGHLWFNSPYTPCDLTIPERRFGAMQSPGGPPMKNSNSYPTLGDQLTTTDTHAGDDVLLTNVVSFTVHVLVTKLPAGSTPPQPVADFIDLFDLSIASAKGANSVFNGLTPAVRVFDTWSSATSTSPAPSPNPTYDYSDYQTNAVHKIPFQIRVGAIQIILRVWDVKTERTRQITIVQDM
jgi:type II secretory pathway pseudopilin PulG